MSTIKDKPTHLDLSPEDAKNLYSWWLFTDHDISWLVQGQYIALSAKIPENSPKFPPLFSWYWGFLLVIALGIGWEVKTEVISQQLSPYLRSGVKEMAIAVKKPVKAIVNNL